MIGKCCRTGNRDGERGVEGVQVSWEGLSHQNVVRRGMSGDLLPIPETRLEVT